MKFLQVKDIFIENKENNLIQEIRNYDNKSLLVISKFETVKLLEENYDAVKFFTAGEVQTKIKEVNYPEELIWNIYLIFFINEELQPRLKRKIESDKFCCKKYVFNCKESENIDKVITDNIPIFFRIDNFKKDKDKDKSPDKIFDEEVLSKQLQIEIKKVGFENFMDKDISMKDIERIYLKGENNEN